MENNSYNPDVLNCLANLSNDEVFTPPTLANQMLDLLPKELFSDPNTTFLDPFCKSGVFLREIVKRLDRGLQSVIPDRRERIDHIMHKQVFGIAITELTSLLSRRSLYCSKHADGEHSVSRFNTPEGNLLYTPLHHSWEKGKCRYCGASQEVYDRGEASEQYAYQFIHTDNPERIFNMKFDVIIGNPPYQLSTGGVHAQATPLYDKFVCQAKKISPRYLIMITPSRWFSGGMGLDAFRRDMLSDNHIRYIVDYPNSADCFPGVEIKGGVSFFLWDKNNAGKCVVKTIRGESEETALRELLEPGCDVFIRFNQSISILRKVRAMKEDSFAELVSVTDPFGIPTNFNQYKIEKTSDDEIEFYGSKVKGYVRRSLIHRGEELIDHYKVLLTEAYGAGEGYPHQILNLPFVAGNPSCCSFTYIVLGPVDKVTEAENISTYVKTRFFRFMVSLKKTTQHATKSVYQFVPLQDFSHPWTDEMLYKKYNLTEEEIAFIESMIRPME